MAGERAIRVDKSKRAQKNWNRKQMEQINMEGLLGCLERQTGYSEAVEPVNP